MVNALCFSPVLKCVPGSCCVVFMQGVLNNALFRGRLKYGSFIVIVVAAVVILSFIFSI